MPPSKLPAPAKVRRVNIELVARGRTPARMFRPIQHVRNHPQYVSPAASWTHKMTVQQSQN